MMNYNLHPQMILRAPRFPVNREDAGLEELLSDPVFRDALYLASDSLFNELSRHHFQPDMCSEKMKHTLAKYLKRTCYRATPFGSFAGLTICNFTGKDEGRIKIESGSFQLSLAEKNQVNNSCNGLFYYINPFLYSYGTDFRLVGRSEKDNKSAFAISEIYGSDLVRELLSGDRIIDRDQLLSVLRNHEIEEDSGAFISELIQLQIIIPHYPLTAKYPIALAESHKANPGSTYDSYCSFSTNGSLPQSTGKQIFQALYCLDKICDRAEPEALRKFKSQFEKLFDRQETPLLQALDPELGIDYDGLSRSSVSSHGSGAAVSKQWSPLHDLLLRKWTGKSGNGIQEIELLDEDLAAFNSTQKQHPPAISVLFTLCGDKLHFKSAGGVSSLNMIGRFTVLDPQIHDLARELALKEIQANPDVVFAELSHIDSLDMASVKQKAIVYDYQIPFFEAPELPEDFLIHLNDLTISLANNKIRLRSRRLNKQVIPRFSSAYNYHRSTLPIFRFLCDLQQEGVHANLNFSMRSLFPGLPAYPRVVYKEIILESASWNLDAKELLHLRKLDFKSQFDAFNKIAIELALPDEFSYEVHDHLLHINRTSEKDIELLLKTIPVTGTISFREYLKSQESLVTDESGNSYTHECIAFLSNSDESYMSQQGSVQTPVKEPGTEQKLYPFNDWLYIKIYLHPAGYVDLLCNYIQPFIAENLGEGNISSWFFISYYDDDFHLRIRLKQSPGREGQLLEAYIILEHDLRKLPNIRKLDLTTYFKERERYSSIGIQCAERLFALSSELVLAELSRPSQISDQEDHRLFSGLRYLMMVCNALELDSVEMKEFSNSFNTQIARNDKITWDQNFRERKSDLTNFLTLHREKKPGEIAYLETLRKYTADLTQKEKLSLVADLNHMHLNRLYLVDQQILERKTYYFLHKLVRTALNHQDRCYGL